MAKWPTHQQVVAALRALVHDDPSLLKTGQAGLEELAVGGRIAECEDRPGEGGSDPSCEHFLMVISALGRLYKRGAQTPFSKEEAMRAVVPLLLALDPRCNELPIPAAQDTYWNADRALDFVNSDVRRNRASWLTWNSTSARRRPVPLAAALRRYVRQAWLVVQALGGSVQSPAHSIESKPNGEDQLRAQEVTVLRALRAADVRLNGEALSRQAFEKDRDGHSAALFASMRFHGLLTNHRVAPDRRGKGFGLPEWDREAS